MDSLAPGEHEIFVQDQLIKIHVHEFNPEKTIYEIDEMMDELTVDCYITEHVARFVPRWIWKYKHFTFESGHDKEEFRLFDKICVNVVTRRFAKRLIFPYNEVECELFRYKKLNFTCKCFRPFQEWDQ